MIRGTVVCSCGQMFGFETVQDKVCCPDCSKDFCAKEYESPDGEVAQDGADI